MRQIDKIIKSQSEPKDTNVLWLDTSGENPILKEYEGGEWKTVAGGGGDSSDAIKYSEQELTEAQQMQARKNQGLYYEEVAEIETDIELSQIIYGYQYQYYTWKNIGFYLQGIRDESNNFVPYAAPSSISDVHSFGWETSYSQSTPPADIEVVIGESAVLLSEGIYLLYGPGANIVDGPSNPGKNYQYCIVALDGNSEGLTAGFYYPSYNEQSGIPDIVSVKYLASEVTINKVPDKYLPEIKTDVVQYVPQELTAEQQAQARTNIGAGTSNFNGNPVLVTEQELTESQKMLARKNQGLYYEEEGTEEMTLTWDGDTTGRDMIDWYGDTLYKIADFPDADAIINIVAAIIMQNGTPSSYTYNPPLGVEDMSDLLVSGKYLASGSFAFAKDAVLEQGGQSHTGVYFLLISNSRMTIYPSSCTFNVKSSFVHQIPPKYIKDMYYEGMEIAEQDITLSMYSSSSKTYTWKGVLFYFQWDNATQTPYPAPRTIADVLSFGWKASGQTTEMDVVVGENAAQVADGVYVLYGPDADPDAGPSTGVERYQYCIVAFEGNEESLDAGFYYPTYSEMYYPTKYIDNVKYMGEETVVSKVPAKFLPDTSGEQDIYLEVDNNPYYGSPYIELYGSQYDEYSIPIHAPFDISTVTVKYAKTKGAWAAPASSITADFSSESWELIVEVGATSEMVEVFLEITSNDGHNYGKIVTLDITNQD